MEAVDILKERLRAKLKEDITKVIAQAILYGLKNDDQDAIDVEYKVKEN